MSPKEFNTQLRNKAIDLYREMPWRVSDKDGAFDAYEILLSEFMLQQTQVSRVIPKYEAFLSKFPTIVSLADANLADVLLAWSGLGYNRRAKYLHEAAKILQYIPQPWQYDDLVSCSGVGPNTAKAVRVYAYNIPEVFVETNIRTVFIHYFFAEHTQVNDKQIMALVDKTIDRRSPRIWYWSIMDIGTSLKSDTKDSLNKSTMYKRQPSFKGSLRQIRGLVLKTLVCGPCDTETLLLAINDDRLEMVLKTLQSEGLITRDGSTYSLGS